MEEKIKAIIDYCLKNNISFYFHVVEELKPGNYQIDVHYKHQWIDRNGIDSPSGSKSADGV